MDLEDRFSGRGRAVITASGAVEYAFEGGELTESGGPAPSVFTSAMVRGLTTGEADSDQDGYVGLDELYDYAYDEVRGITPYQTPGKWTFGVQGDLVIARRGNPVTEPSTLPPDLQHSLGSPLAGVRAGAIGELARLLAGRHQGLALAARQALEQMADDDSRTVAAAATEALDAAGATSSEPGTTPLAPAEPTGSARLSASAAATPTRGESVDGVALAIIVDSSADPAGSGGRRPAGRVAVGRPNRSSLHRDPGVVRRSVGGHRRDPKWHGRVQGLARRRLGGGSPGQRELELLSRPSHRRQRH